MLASAAAAHRPLTIVIKSGWDKPTEKVGSSSRRLDGETSHEEDPTLYSGVPCVHFLLPDVSDFSMFRICFHVLFCFNSGFHAWWARRVPFFLVRKNLRTYTHFLMEKPFRYYNIWKYIGREMSGSTNSPGATARNYDKFCSGFERVFR